MAVAVTFPEVVSGIFQLGEWRPFKVGAFRAFLVARPEARILVYSPAYDEEIVRFIESRGGIDFIFLSHCDELSPAIFRYKARFNAKLVLHWADCPVSTEKGTDLRVRGPRTRLLPLVAEALERPEAVGSVDVPFQEDFELAPGVSVLWTPGHSEGSACLYLEKDKVLFSGDAVSLAHGRADIGEETRRRSLAKLAAIDCAWLIPAFSEGEKAWLRFNGVAAYREFLRDPVP